MKFNFKSLSILGLAMTVCLAGLGIGYAGWFETINISGTAVVEFMAVEWLEQETNDPVGNIVPGHVNGADESILDDFVGDPFRLNKDVGWTECIMLDTDSDGYRDTIEFTVHNGYPCYFGKLIGWLKNKGDMWLQIDSVTVTYPDYPQYNYTCPPTGVSGPWPHPAEFEVGWMDGGVMPILIAPNGNKMLACIVHIRQAAAQGAVYRFNVTFHVSGPVAP